MRFGMKDSGIFFISLVGLGGLMMECWSPSIGCDRTKLL